MFSKNNRQMNDKKQGEIITRYTIKKFSFGAASVAVACGIYFANGATAEAQDYSGVTSSVDYEVVAEASDQSLAPEVNLNQASEVDSLASTDQGSDPIESREKLKEEESLNKPQESSEGPIHSASSQATNEDRPVPSVEALQTSRSRRVRRDVTSNSLRDGNPNNTVSKPTLADSENKRPADLMKQINWLDLSDPNSISNLDNGSLKVGTVYEKEISPGYRVKLTVTDLKPFNSTEIYRNRVQGTEHAASYNPNAKNTWLTYAPEYNDQQNNGDDYRPKIIGAAQNQWTAIRDQGINTKGRLTQLQVPRNGANYGVTFNVEATYLNKPVKATVVMADGEEANPGEYAIFTTNGQGWEHLAEWKRVRPDGTEITDTYYAMLPNTDGQYIGEEGSKVYWHAYTNPDQKTGGQVPKFLVLMFQMAIRCHLL